MKLYHQLSLESFIKGWESSIPSQVFSLPAIQLMHAVPEEQYTYGLSLLRRAIGLYEEKMGIPVEESKKNMPFFREYSRMLVGPEMEIYMLPFYPETSSFSFDFPASGEDRITLVFDYEALAAHCLSENMFLVRCQYEEEQIVRIFTEQMEQEYDKFFFDDEHTGFTRDSRFFSMLCNAVLQVREPAYASQEEWRLAFFKSPEEVDYRYVGGDLQPYFNISLPLSALLQIRLEEYREKPLLFGALAGFLKSKGVSPERCLEGRLEEE